MTEPKPLLRSHPSGPVANLLRAARADVPPAKGRRRTLAALGTAAGIAAATSATEAAAAVGVGTTAMVKTVVGAAIAIAATGGAAFVGTRATVAVVSHFATPATAASTNGSSPDRVPARTAVAAPVAPPAFAAPVAPSVVSAAPDLPAPPLSAPLLAPTAPVPVGPSVAEKSRAAPPILPRKTEEPPTPGGLAAELAAVDRARRALQTSDPREALRELDAYEARFSPPRFEQEATLLRVEALTAIGDGDRARAIGERFLAREPESTYSRRIRSLLGEHPAPAR